MLLTLIYCKVDGIKTRRLYLRLLSEIISKLIQEQRSRPSQNFYESQAVMDHQVRLISSPMFMDCKELIPQQSVEMLYYRNLTSSITILMQVALLLGIVELDLFLLGIYQRHI